MTTTNAAVKDTTTNNAANNAANDQTNAAAEAAKASRVTLISALLAGDAEQVAGVLLKQGRSLDEIKAFADTFKKSVASFKTLHAQQEEQRKQEEAQREALRKEEEEARTKAAALIETAKKEAINKMVKDLEADGVSPAMALQIAQSTLGGSTGTRGSTAPKQRVKCKYNGVEYMVAVTGNNKNDTKKAIEESGKTREEFIEAYKVQ